MAPGGKKKVKTRWNQLDQSLVINPNAPRKLTTSNWADESNEVDDSFDYGRKPDVKASLPTAPRAARGAENDATIPKEPPFQVYLSNLSYEVTEDDLNDFFAELKVKSVRLPRDDRNNTVRARGFGYVEFEDRNSLIEALTMPDTTCKNRRMRIEVADIVDQARVGRGGQRDRGPNEPDRTLGDWRSGPRSDAESSSDRDSYRSAPRREYGNDRGNGMYGDRERRFRDDERDRGGFRNRDGFRDSRGGFRDDRGGGFRDERPGGFREERGGGGYRGDERGGYRDNGSDRYERRGYEERREERRYDDRRDDRRVGEYSGGDRGTWRKDENPREGDPGPPPLDRNSEPKTRTRLNLQPRSRPVVGGDGGGSGDASASTVSTGTLANSASIFGEARPVDTAARERQIEERLAKQRDDRLPPSREESKPPAPQRDPVGRDPAPSYREEAPPSSPPLESAPPPKENVWARRSQQNTHSQVNNGRISPHEEGERHIPRDSSPSKEPRKYQPPRRNIQDDKKRDERHAVRGGGTPRGGGPRNVDMRQTQPPKSRDQKKESSEEIIRMPKMQEHQAPNFIGSNKYAFLEDSESAAD